jgi:pyruvate formate-lyase activating enzyme-like uncharacterized protein
MRVKQIKDEDFLNYKKTSMLIATCFCDWKCLKEKNLDLSICHNSQLALENIIDISSDKIITRYLSNSISKAVVIAGLEPMLQFDEILEFIQEFRKESQDDIAIYTGYYENEIADKINLLKQYKNIIVKFGRFTPDNNKRYDDVLGVWLASDNQYAIKIS